MHGLSLSVQSLYSGITAPFIPAHLGKIIIVQRRDLVLKVEESREEGDPIISSLFIVLHLASVRNLQTTLTYLDKVNVVLFALSVNVFKLSQQRLILGGGLVQEDHSQVVVAVDESVEHGNCDGLDLVLLQLVQHPLDHLVIIPQVA